MEISGFHLDASELDGCKFIEMVCPEQINVSQLSTALAAYVALWDDEQPTVTLTDISRLNSLDEGLQVLSQVLVQRFRFDPCLVSAAWVYGDNEHIHSVFFEVLSKVKGSERALFATREEAVAALRERIAAWRERKASAAADRGEE